MNDLSKTPASILPIQRNKGVRYESWSEFKRPIQLLKSCFENQFVCGTKIRTFSFYSLKIPSQQSIILSVRLEI